MPVLSSMLWSFYAKLTSSFVPPYYYTTTVSLQFTENLLTPTVSRQNPAESPLLDIGRGTTLAGHQSECNIGLGAKY